MLQKVLLFDASHAYYHHVAEHLAIVKREDEDFAMAMLEVMLDCSVRVYDSQFRRLERMLQSLVTGMSEEGISNGLLARILPVKEVCTACRVSRHTRDGAMPRVVPARRTFA